jgi:hypothetical protein
MLEQIEQEERINEVLERNLKQFNQFGLSLKLAQVPFSKDNWLSKPLEVVFRDGGHLFLSPDEVGIMGIGLTIGHEKVRQDDTMRDFRPTFLP